MTQSARVLQAVRDGYSTSQEIAAATGISLHCVAAYLSRLSELMMIRRVGRTPRNGATGRLGYIYAPLKGEPRRPFPEACQVRCWGARLSLRPADALARPGAGHEIEQACT